MARKQQPLACRRHHPGIAGEKCRRWTLPCARMRRWKRLRPRARQIRRMRSPRQRIVAVRALASHRRRRLRLRLRRRCTVVLRQRTAALAPYRNQSWAVAFPPTEWQETNRRLRDACASLRCRIDGVLRGICIWKLAASAEPVQHKCSRLAFPCSRQFSNTAQQHSASIRQCTLPTKHSIVFMVQARIMQQFVVPMDTVHFEYSVCEYSTVVCRANGDSTFRVQQLRVQ